MQILNGCAYLSLFRYEGTGWMLLVSSSGRRSRIKGTGEETRPQRPPGAAVDDGQHLHPFQSGRQHQDGQGKIHRKIDGVVATIIILDRAIRCGNDTSASVYDSRAFCLYNSRIFFP